MATYVPGDNFGKMAAQPSIGGKSSDIGGKSSMKTMSSGRSLNTFGKKNPFSRDGSGKLNTSGSTTKSESIARLRGKGALA